MEWWGYLIAAGAFLLGAIAIFLFFKLVPGLKKGKANKEADAILKEAEMKADRIRKTAELDAKQASFEAKQKAQEEIRQMKKEVLAEQTKLDAREQSLEARNNRLTQKEDALEEKQENLNRRLEETAKKKEELDKKIDSIITELEKVSGMSVKEAHDEIMARVESKMSMEISAYIKNAEDEAKDTAEEKAKNLLAFACSKYAQDVVTEKTVSVIALPNDEMKGRIIGREGRNIRVLEQTLGVDLVIDDTPEVITVSCFNPIRREIARRTLEILVKDGRIQPGRIEEVAEKVKKELDAETQRAGEQACMKLGLPRINRELSGYLGKLKYRTSYGQNVLEHSIEVGYLAGIMASELGLDQNLARRAGLLHDVGKSVDYEKEGSHAELGVELAKRYNEPDVVVNAIASHHGDVEPKYIISHLVMAADALSAARPGARSETLETYIKRVTQLEEIAKGFEGVSNAYAVQAGREVRIMVDPEKISDAETIKLAQDIREKIESDMQYPGNIKIFVLREYKAIETAK